MIASLGSKQKNSEILKKIKDLGSDEDQDKEAKFNEIVNQLEELKNKEERKPENPESDPDDSVNPDDADIEELEKDVVPDDSTIVSNDLPQIKSFDSLKAVDLLVEAGITSDYETI